MYKIWVCLGAFNFLKENFSNAPSLDMSSPSLCMLVRLMIAQVQECVFEKVTLTTQDTHFTSQLQVAQEAARVRGPVCVCVCVDGQHVLFTGAHDLDPVPLLKTSLLFTSLSFSVPLSLSVCAYMRVCVGDRCV